MDNRLKEIQERLCKITKGCRVDMHEPDEQGVTARVVGTCLDNAWGDEINAEFLREGHQEIVVVLQKDGVERDEFNLADLIALARMVS